MMTTKTMNKITVEIEWDWPDELFWLNADTVASALHAHCKNTRFVVEEHRHMPRRKFLIAALATLAALACGDWAERRNKWFKRTGNDRPEPGNGKRGDDDA